MNNPLLVYISQWRSFWTIRSKITHLNFLKNRFLFGIRNSAREENASVKSFWSLCLLTVKQLLLAIAVASLLQYIDSFFLNYYQKLGLKIPDDGDYVTFLATVSGVGGVFIGLYYTALSSVAGAIYSKVPNNIMDLLAQERIGNVYMRFLALFTFIGLSLISLRIIGYPRVYLAIPIMTILGGIAIIAFVKLGQRAFYFFDPTTLSFSIFEKLNNLVKQVTFHDSMWADKSFQKHAQKQASYCLETLATLSDITSNETHLSGESLVSLSKSTLAFLNKYEISKKHIPSESQWYGQKYSHKRWYKSSDTAISIAHQTSTAIQPVEVADYLWVEDKAFQIVKKCLSVNLQEGRYSEVIKLLSSTDVYLQTIAKENNLQKSFDLFKEVNQTVQDIICTESKEYVLDDEILEMVGISEYIASIPINIFISYLDSIGYVDKKEISCKVKQVQWKYPGAVYWKNFHAYLLPRLEWLQTRLVYEELIDKKVVTPNWYLTELVSQKVADQLSENIYVVIDDSLELYEQMGKKADEAKRPWMAAAILSREIEYISKLRVHFHILENAWNNISDHRKIEGLPWEKVDLQEKHKKIKKRQNELYVQMSSKGALLSFATQKENFPDYGGQFIHTSGEEFFDAISRNDADTAKLIYGNYFHGIILQYENLRPKDTTGEWWRVKIDLKIASAPLLDLLDLSGYACLCSLYYGNSVLWEIVESVWNEYFEKEEHLTLINILSMALQISEIDFEIPHRSTLRIHWSQNINKLLSNVPKREECHPGSMSLTSHTVIEHKSPIVRIFAGDRYGLSYNGVEIFIVEYLLKRTGSGKFDFGKKHKRLSGSIAREVKNYKSESSGGNTE